MSAASTKKKPLIFKRRAGPVSTAPIAALDSDSDSDSSPVPRPAKATAAGNNEGSGVDLFRRAKQFFPRAIEEQNQRMLAEAHRKQQSPADAPDHTPISTPDPEEHGSKRRKVSYETADSDRDDSRDQQQKAKPSSRSSSPAKRHGKTTTSPSPAPSSIRGSPPLRAGSKGKGIATPHTVNSQVVFSSVSGTGAADNSLVLLDNEGGYDERAAIDAAIAQIKAEECTEPVQGKFKAEPENTIVYEVEDDNDEDDNNGNGNEKGDDNDDDDFVEAANPEFNEYILQARARDAAARAAQAVREAAGIGRTPRGRSATATATTSGTGTANASQSVADSSPRSTPASSGTLPSCDQNYRIFMTPHLPEPVPPLIATMRMDQKMHFVQAAFLDHARKKGVHLSDEAAAGVVLTWKGIKIYSWTTGQSLDIHPDAHGKFRDDGRVSGSRTGASRQPAGFVSGGLHLEIWTQELYNAYLKDQERRRLRKLGEAVDLDLDSSSSSEDGDGGDVEIRNGGAHDGRGGGSGAGGQPAAANSQRIRLVLKSRDHEKLNMTVYADTKVETLIAAFREQRNIAPEQTIAIHWDGERLDEDTTVEDAEMEDMDSVEVFIH